MDEGWLHRQGLGSCLPRQRTDGYWWKPTSLMVRLTHSFQIGPCMSHIAAHDRFRHSSQLDPSPCSTADRRVLQSAVTPSRRPSMFLASTVQVSPGCRQPARHHSDGSNPCPLHFDAYWGARPPARRQDGPHPVFCQLCSRVMSHFCSSPSDSHCQTSALATGRRGPDQATQTNYGTRAGFRNCWSANQEHVQLRQTLQYPLLGNDTGLEDPGNAKARSMNNSRPFMAERDVVWAACSRSEHPLFDSVFSKRKDILMCIGPAVSICRRACPHGVAGQFSPTCCKL